MLLKLNKIIIDILNRNHLNTYSFITIISQKFIEKCYLVIWKRLICCIILLICKTAKLSCSKEHIYWSKRKIENNNYIGIGILK